MLPRRIAPLPSYAELHCRSNCSFLTGASHPEELVARAQALGYSALALTDECSLGGVVRAHAEAERLRLRLIVGAEMGLSAPASKGNAASVAAGGLTGLTGLTGQMGQAAGSGSARAPAPQAEPRLVLLAQSRRGYGNLACRPRRRRAMPPAWLQAA